jgi:protein-disulfide isomerase
MIRTLTVSMLAALIATAAWSAGAPSSPAPATPAPAASAPASAPSKDASSTSAVSKAATPDTLPVKPLIYTPKDSDIVSGKDSAPVTIVEYASLSCPHCSHFFLKELPALTTKYIDTGKMRLVFRNYPLNDPALKAAELVQCAPADSRHAFIKVLFDTQLKWAYDANYRDALSNVAMLGGIDRLKFESCMNNKAIEKTIIAVAKEAADVYHVNSTPSFFINGTPYKGTYDSLTMGKAIDAAAAKSAQK